MTVFCRSMVTPVSVFASLFLFLLGPQLSFAADDMWDGVFTYQKKMADYGNAEAQHKLGEMYEEGHGTPQDFDKALEWYRKAAAQGYAPASKKVEQVKLRKQRAVAEVKAKEKRTVADRASLEREKAEQQRAEQQRAEEERIAKEKADQEQAKKVARGKGEKEHQASKQMQEKEKKRQAEEEHLARERAKAAMKAMMAVPSAYTED
jgi:hypothetical protein